MKIGWYLPHLKKFGGVRRALESCEEMAKLGHDVTIYHSDGSPCDWFNPSFKIKSEKQMYLDEMDVLVHTMESDYQKAISVNAKLKVYYILHYGVLYKHPEICKASYQQKGNLHLANSEWTANHILSETGSKPQVVHGGLNQNMFKDLGLERSKDKFVVRAYGHPRVWKGREDVKFAIEMLKEQIPNLDFKFFHDMNLTDEQYVEEINKTHIYISGSWFEGWSQIQLESMACGTAVVTTRDGGSEDYCEDGMNCIQTEPKKPMEIIEAVMKLYNDRKLMAKLIENGFETAKKFTWKQSAEELIKIFKLQI